MLNENKPNIYSVDEENKKNYTTHELIFAKEKQTKEDGDESGEGSGGIALDSEQLHAYLLACYNKERRRLQQKFGLTPFSDDPNRFLGKKSISLGASGELPCSHPLLARSQRFCGDDRKITADPTQNSHASKNFPELRQENQLRKNLGFGKKKSVTLMR
jgi:hypothetical protein